MNNIDNLIITCESLMIGTVMEGTNKDVKAIMSDYKGRIADVDKQMQELIPTKKWSKIRTLLKEDEKLTKECLSLIGDVEESGIKNVVSLINPVSAILKIGNKKESNRWKEEGYKQKGLGSFTKQYAYSLYKKRLLMNKAAFDNLQGLKDGEELVLPK